jgi:hypothetical protein
LAGDVRLVVRDYLDPVSRWSIGAIVTKTSSPKAFQVKSIHNHRVMKQLHQYLQPFFSLDFGPTSLFGDGFWRDRGVIALGELFQSIAHWTLFDFSHYAKVADSVGLWRLSPLTKAIPKHKAASGSRCGFWRLNLSATTSVPVQYSFKQKTTCGDRPFST